MRQRIKQRKLPKPKKTRRNSFRKSLAKNRDILLLIGVIIAALTLILRAYAFFSQTNPRTEPKPQPKIEQHAPTIPVQPADMKCLWCRPGSRPDF